MVPRAPNSQLPKNPAGAWTLQFSTAPHIGPLQHAPTSRRAKPAPYTHTDPPAQQTTHATLPTHYRGGPVHGSRCGAQTSKQTGKPLRSQGHPMEEVVLGSLPLCNKTEICTAKDRVMYLQVKSAIDWSKGDSGELTLSPISYLEHRSHLPCGVRVGGFKHNPPSCPEINLELCQGRSVPTSPWRVPASQRLLR